MRLYATAILVSAFSLPIATSAIDLVEIFRLAQQKDPVFLAAEATYRADRYLVKQARADLLPTISATANQAQNDKTVNGTPQMFGSSGYTLSVRQPLINWARYEELRQAKAEVRRAEAVHRAAGQELILRVTTLYFDILSARDSLALSESEQAAIARQLELAKARLEVGLGTTTEVHDANARHKLAIAQSIDAKNNLLDTRQALAETVGLLPVNLKKLKKNIPLRMPDPPAIKSWTDMSKKQNLLLIAAIAESEIARHELYVNRAGHLPTLDVVGSRTQSDSVDPFGGDLKSANNSLRIELTVPIYSGGKTRALTGEAKYRHQAAMQNLEAVRRSVFRTTRKAFLGIQGGVSRVHALEQAVIAGESALEAKQIGFEAGISSNIDVLNAQRDLFRSRRDYAQSRYRYLLNLLELKEAAGTLNVTDLNQITEWLE